jgi:hypothetical protein
MGWLCRARMAKWGSYKTHILFGKLRVFSFFSDGGQFGANQGYTGVVFLIYAMSQVKYYLSSFHLCWSLGIYGMVISGTRGISCSYSWLYDLFCEQNVKVIIIGVSF